MKQLLNKFCNLFPKIEFEIIEKESKANNISLESASTGEKEIVRMLNIAKRDLAKFKKIHKHGKISVEEVLDHEWRVHELQEELIKFQEGNTNLDGDDIFDI